MDPFWETDRPHRQQPQQEDGPGASSAQKQHAPMKECEIGSVTVSVGGPAVNWAEYVNVKSVQYIKMDHALNVDAEEPNDWDLGNAVRETEKQFTTYLRLLMTDNKRSKPPQNARLSRATIT